MEDIEEMNERLKTECNCLAEQNRELIRRVNSLEEIHKKDIEVIYKLAAKLANC